MFGDHHRLSALCANTEKQHKSVAAAALSEWLAWLFSADKVAVVEGVAMMGKENFLREGLGQSVCPSHCLGLTVSFV